MLIDIETRHDEWRTVEVADATLPDAAYAAVRSTFTFLTDDNHRRADRPDAHGAYCGTVRTERLHDLLASEYPADLRLARMVRTFGSTSAGDSWITCHWREHQPHRTAARDSKGRRWVMVRLESGYGMWECVSDLSEYRHAVPGPWYPNCCGTPGRSGLVDAACQRCGSPWTVGGEPASDLELALLDAVRLDRHLVTLCVDLTAGRTTPAQARDRLGHCGRGLAGSEVFRRKVVRLGLQLALAEAGQPLWPFDYRARVAADTRTIVELARFVAERAVRSCA